MKAEEREETLIGIYYILVTFIIASLFCHPAELIKSNNTLYLKNSLEFCILFYNIVLIVLVQSVVNHTE